MSDNSDRQDVTPPNDGEANGNHHDVPLDFFLSEEEEEEFMREWEEADRSAVVLLRESLPEVVAAVPPYDDLSAAADRVREGIAADRRPYPQLANAAAWEGGPPSDDVELWLGAAGALIAMREESGLGIELESTLVSMQHADWAGAVIQLVRAGVGASAAPRRMCEYIDSCPEIEGEIEQDDVEIIEGGFEIILDAWQAVGAVDANQQLTPLGWWGLPRALAWAWDGDLDAEPDYVEPGDSDEY